MAFCFHVKGECFRIYKNLQKASPKTWAETFTSKLKTVFQEAVNFARGNEPSNKNWWSQERIQTVSRNFLAGVKERSEGRHEVRVGSAIVQGLAEEVVQLQQSL